MRSLSLVMLCFAALTPVATAHADTTSAPDDLALARADIVDARHGREPQRVHLLGFDRDGAAYVRSTLCEVGDASGLLSCRVTVDKLAADGSRTTTTLLSVEDQGCDGDACPSPITYAVARDFLAAERAFRAALPPLVPGAPIADGAHALGADVRLAVEVDGDTAAHPRLRLVARRGKARVTLWSRSSSEDERIERAARVRAWASPDGTHAVLAAAFGTGVMCWGPFAEHAAAQVDRAAVDAHLRGS